MLTIGDYYYRYVATPRIGPYMISVHSFTQDNKYAFVSYPDDASRQPEWLIMSWFDSVRLTPIV